MNQALKSKKILRRIILSVLILSTGATGMIALANLKKPPAEVRYEEPAIQVEAVKVSPESAPVIITGYGEVRALNVVPISPEVSGKIIKIHPKLEMGEIVAEGELLFAIDPADYQAAYHEAKSSVERWKQSIRILETKYELDKERLKTV
jgi:multidrug efflux pump subunit AcrA (membrane-fusion protein)